VSERKSGLKLLLVAAAWLGVARLLAEHGARYLPRALARELTLHSFLSLVLVVATALGLGLALLLVARPVDALGVRGTRPAALGAAALAAPLVVTASAWLAFRLALPTLLAEIEKGGRRAVEIHTGAYGRAIVQTHLATTLLWAIVLVPIAEELVFRGALWSAVTRLTHADGAAPPSLPPELVREGAAVRALGGIGRLLRAGGIATLVSAAVFAWLHADQKGGAGVVRVVQVAVLGVVLGCARHATGSIWPGVLLHALFNLATVAKMRDWLPREVWPFVMAESPSLGREIRVPLPIPLFFWQLTAAAAPLLLVVWLHGSRRLRTVEMRARVTIARAPEAVFDFIVAPDTIPRIFHGHGPIPGAVDAEVEGGTMAEGAVRIVRNADATVVSERITAFERPRRQSYRIERGLRPPFSLFVRGGEGHWTFAPDGDETHVEWRFCFELRSPLAWPIVVPLRAAFRRAMEEALGRARESLEETPARAADRMV
jgi:membrane protease YdiL (CAAX protease family)/uncharacterized protein YndB with AHSA1/START domain